MPNTLGFGFHLWKRRAVMGARIMNVVLWIYVITILGIVVIAKLDDFGLL
jgi:hypothetical protein